MFIHLIMFIHFIMFINFIVFIHFVRLFSQARFRCLLHVIQEIIKSV